MNALLDALLSRYPDLEVEWAAYRAEGHADAAGFLERLSSGRRGDETYVGPEDVPSTFAPDVVSGIDAGVPHDVPGRGIELGDIVGRGAMGEVRLAIDRDLNRTVAWKVMTANASARPDLAAAFWCEAQITSQLDHPHIVPIYGLTRAHDGRLAYTMRRVAGDTVEAWIDACARHPDEEAYGLARRLEVFLKVCDAIQFAHDHGVLHRDLKPSNLMLGAHGEAYVMDWGIASLVTRAGATPHVEGYTYHTGGATDGAKISVIGTPGYMSPEQAIGDPDQGPASDQYALGLILHELVTLQPAVPGNNARKRLARHIRGEVEPMGRDAAPELAAIVARATHTDPDARYASVIELADDLRRHRRGDAVHALPDTLWRGAVRWVRAHASLVAMASLGMLLALAVTVVGSQALLLRDRAAASRHERALSELMAATATQAARIDSRFVHFEGQAEALASSARLALTSKPPEPVEAYFLADFQGGARPPPDYATSTAYGVPISLAHPVLLEGDGGHRDVARLLPLHPQLLRAVATTLPGEPARTPTALRQRLEAPDAHAAYATVALERGGVMSFPGHAGFPEGYDPRARPWYQTGRAASDATWGAPYVDAGSGELNLPCSAPVVVDGTTVGVASLKLSLAAVVGDLLSGDQGTRALIDADGKVLARHPAGAQVAAVDPTDVGTYQLEGQRLRVVQPIESHGWALVVEGEADVLLRP